MTKLKRLSVKKQTLQKNSKRFRNFMIDLFPDMSMGAATERLSEDLYRAITFGEDIGKKYKKMIKHGKK